MQPLTNIDLRLIHVFIKVVECGGFAAAQAELGKRASTVSTHIASLESRLGCRLCERGRTGFKLTPEGRAVYEAAERLYAAIHQFRQETGALKGRLAGDLFVGIHDNTVSDARAPLHQAIGHFMSRDAKVHIHLRIAPPNELQRAIAESALHVVVGISPTPLAALDYEPLYIEPVRLFCSSNHPLFERADDGVDLDEIRASNIVSRGYWKDRDLDYLGLKASAATVWDMETQLILIRSGHYLGLLPVHYAQRWVDQGELKPLLPDTLQFETQIFIITRRAAKKTLVLRRFLEDVRATFAEAARDERAVAEPAARAAG